MVVEYIAIIKLLIKNYSHNIRSSKKLKKIANYFNFIVNYYLNLKLILIFLLYSFLLSLPYFDNATQDQTSNTMSLSKSQNFCLKHFSI